MSTKSTSTNPDFWAPQFQYEHRKNGTILMRQAEELDEFLPLLADYLDKWADEEPDRVWLARRGLDGNWVKITYGEARVKATAIGSALLEMGLGPERPLLILSENSLEHAMLGLACVYVGIPFAPISPAYSLLSTGAKKAKSIVELLNPGAIFADDGEKFADALGVLCGEDCVAINSRNHIAEALHYDEITKRTPKQNCMDARGALTSKTVAKYLFTSGSTGTPKAVINTNGMICAMQSMLRDFYRFAQNEPPITVDWAPWNHTAGGNNDFYFIITNGGTLYLDDGRPVPGSFDATLQTLREVACNWYFNVPVGYDMLVEALENDPDLAKFFFSKLKVLFYAGAGMAQHTWDRLMALSKQYTGREILLTTALGATETAPFALGWSEIEDTAGKVGVPARGLTLKLVPSDGKLEARLKGPSITPGYYGDPEKTAEAFDEEGFYCLGDALRPADPNDFSRGFYFDGRVAENFKLSTGTWVSVGAIRAKLVDAFNGLIRDAVIVGENEPELGALLWISDAASQMSQSDLQDAISEHLASAAKAGTGSATRVRRAMILQQDPSFDKGELTEKGSLNQRILRLHNSKSIDALYQSDENIFKA